MSKSRSLYFTTYDWNFQSLAWDNESSIKLTSLAPTIEFSNRFDGAVVEDGNTDVKQETMLRETSAVLVIPLLPRVSSSGSRQERSVQICYVGR